MEVMEQTMADGPGLRTSIYCAGCEHHCPGCHNPQSWKFENGHKMSIDDLMQVIKDDDISNVSFSGGDPFYQVEGFTELARRIKTETDKTIWCWTGFTYEEILADSHLSMLLPLSGRSRGRAIYRGSARHPAAFPRQLEPEDHPSHAGRGRRDPRYSKNHPFQVNCTWKA